MKRFIILLAISSYFLAPLTAQKLSKELKTELGKIRFVEGGTFIMGNATFDNIPADDTLLGLPPMERRVTVSSFYISSVEVTNADWQRFYAAMVDSVGEEKAKQLYAPDTASWVDDFDYSYGEPKSIHYHAHPAYADYPVVGVSWIQAQAYCRWYSDYINQLLKAEGILPIPNFRLPTEAEWEYAAIGEVRAMDEEMIYRNIMYSWGGVNTFMNEKGCYLGNFGAIHDTYGNMIKSYDDDGYIYSGVVASYFPNGFGLYNMSGNVAEWVQDVYRPDFLFAEELMLGEVSVRREEEPMDSLTFVKQYIEKIDGRYNDARSLDSLDEQQKAAYLKYILNPRAKMAWREYKFTMDYNEEFRVTKGGGWSNPLPYLQIGSRARLPETAQNSWTGFRLCMTRVTSPTMPHPAIEYIDKQSAKKK